ncbi:MAG: hypothetical protein A2X64_10885 [Ignavibacteria bacterium GWF2_33_9]|nr:MAG: hypothetical protein A2X64_10885 [Ignavibacteria bacterium GWF2_33_9]
MGKADLHNHTFHSDGLFSPNALMIKAKKKGIEHIAITDHDTISNIPQEAELAKGFGLDFIYGCEVSAFQGGKDYHIVALDFQLDTPKFVEHFDNYFTERMQRAETMVKKFSSLGINISIESIIEQAGNAPIGRPHVARAVVKAGYAKDSREVFHKFLYDHGPAYQPKSNLSVKKVIELIHSAGGVAILAHPANFFNMDEIHRVVKDGIDGIEVNHPLHNQDLRQFYGDFAQKNNLLISGGSDFHGSNDDENNIGTSFVTEKEVAKIREASKKIRSKPIFKHLFMKLF